jgi:DNA polymerase-3 subunit delta'
MQNWNLIGHQWAVELLKGHLAAGMQRHAYLFTGPQGVGRRTLALAFAQALNAVNPPAVGEFDGEERTSQQIARMQHPDLNILQVEADKRDISVEQVRELSRGLALAPYSAPYKIALLLNFEHASHGAENALLKTLEEPPARVILLITAESAEALLPTTASRCEALRLRPVALPEVTAGLERRGIPPERARLLAHISGGRPGYALRLHEDEHFLEQRGLWLDEQVELIGGDRVTRFAYADQIAKDKERFTDALQVWLSFWRDVLLKAGGSDAPLANLDRAAHIERIAAGVPLPQARALVAQIEDTAGLLRLNANVRLAAEVLLLALPRLSI